MKRITKPIILSVFLMFSLSAAAEPVTTILNSGPSGNRVDIVVLGDGYTSAEMQKYADDVQSAIDDFFAAPPFDEYKSYFNVHVIDVISNESGSDHSEADPPTYKDTALDSYYNCRSERLICVDTGKVQTIINNSVAPSAQDIKLIIVNDPVYGGSGGSVAVASTNGAASELVLHEIGHSFGLLADEYTYGSSNCDAPIEPAQVNVTTKTLANDIKWKIWIEDGTLIPTTDTSLLGLFEGGKYCPNNIYRPTDNSKMRNLSQPFEQVNEEQLVKRIYNFVSPLDSQLPTQLNIDLTKGEVRDFQLTTLQPEDHDLSITWILNGTVVSTNSTTYMLDTNSMEIGDHTLRYEIEDTTLKVRHDSASVLKESGQWNITLSNVMRGDCTGDGTVDISDVICVINAVLSSPSIVLLATDCNESEGAIDINDVICTIDKVLNP